MTLIEENVFFQITKKGEQSLRRTTRTKIKRSIGTRIHEEPRELEPTVVLEPSETTLALLVHEEMNENANLSPPEAVPPNPNSDPAPNGDLASS
ncbi:cysteine-rich perinuclear theca protein 1-like [Mastomys coucha]|uniref:cysteine-rich perinuclear theca protein 1-like n=1 Tax=Mastomys coucha TaxID=35658 RepID=UPI00126249E0|nr:cysteine-rich perinuclear theca protein 1-like [Mastomys coucha]